MAFIEIDILWLGGGATLSEAKWPFMKSVQLPKE